MNKLFSFVFIVLQSALLANCKGCHQAPPQTSTEEDIVEGSHGVSPPVSLAEMGWHCITVWECELKPKVREQTLKSLAFTLNKIWLEDHRVTAIPYPKLEEEDYNYTRAAEDK